MKKLLPEPSEYLDTILSDVKYNITKDITNISRELVKNIIGFDINHFGDIKISQEKTNLVRSKISPDLIKKIEDDIVIKVEENLEAAITKKYINQMISDVLDRIYRDVEKRIQQTISDKISNIVTEKINETLTTWLVASKFIETHELPKQ